MIKKALFALILASVTVFTVSVVEVNCRESIYSFITAWLRTDGTSPSIHQLLVVSQLLLNIGLMFLIYFVLIFNIKNIKKRYVSIALFALLVSGFNLYGEMFLRGVYVWHDDGDLLNMTTQFEHNEPFKKQLSWFLNFQQFSDEECKNFY